MVTLAFAQMAYFVVPRHQGSAAAATASSCTSSRRSRSAARRCSTSASAARSTTRARARWPSPTACSRCCCARASAMRWPASASTSSACAPRASRPTPYKLAAFVDRRRARRAGRLPARGQGRRGQSRAAVLARVGRGAADDHPRRHRHLRGAVIGAVAFTLLKELLSSRRRWSARSPTHWQLTLGPDHHRLRRRCCRRA